MAIPGNMETSGGFNWDHYTGGVTGQPTASVDPAGTNDYALAQGAPSPSTPRGNDFGLDSNLQLSTMGGQPQASGGQGDPEGFRAAWFASGGKTTDDLKAFVAAHPEYGATISGSKGSKLTFPGGQAFQAVRSAGLGGGIGPAWDDISGGGAAQGANGAPGGSASVGYGSLLAPWTQNFSAPTAEQALGSPGLQFALDEANRIGQNSAAAHGTLLNGRVQQALQGSNVSNALQGYGDVYNRALGEYGIQRQNFYDNQDRPYSKLSGLAGLGENAAAQTGNYGTSYGQQGSGAIYGAGNASAAGSVAQGNVWGPYVNNLAALERTNAS